VADDLDELEEFMARVEEPYEPRDEESRYATLLELIEWCDAHGVSRGATRIILNRAAQGQKFIIDRSAA